MRSVGARVRGRLPGVLIGLTDLPVGRVGASAEVSEFREAAPEEGGGLQAMAPNGAGTRRVHLVSGRTGAARPNAVMATVAASATSASTRSLRGSERLVITAMTMGASFGGQSTAMSLRPP